MSKWKEVGEWLKNNASGSAVLIGSLLTGNVPGAISAGAAMVRGATATDHPEAALLALKDSSQYLVDLKRIAAEEHASIREHLAAMELMELEDEQREHHETQETIRNGDKLKGRTRPGLAIASFAAASAYVLLSVVCDKPIIIEIIPMFLGLPFAYMGLRQIGKWKDAAVSNQPQS